jgi:hypothetical protein
MCGCVRSVQGVPGKWPCVVMVRGLLRPSFVVLGWWRAGVWRVRACSVAPQVTIDASCCLSACTQNGEMLERADG